MNGPDINHPNDRNLMTPLHLAAQKGDEEIVEILLKAKANPNASGSYIMTPLHQAARYGNVNAARLLLEYGADVNACAGEDSTPLHLAAEFGHKSVVELLIGYEANQHALNMHGLTAFDEAGYKQRSEIEDLLWPLMNPININGYTCLYQAAKYGDVQAVKALLRCGVNVHRRNKHWRLPLHYAVMSKNVEVITVLLEAGAMLEATDGNSFSPLVIAAEIGNLEAAKVLLEAGANVHWGFGMP